MIPTRPRRHWVRVAALLLSGTLIATACGSDDDDAAGSTTTDASSAEAGSAAETDPCVADVATVVDTPPSEASTTEPLPEDLVAELDAAAAASFAEAAAPGAIVGVRTPDGTWIETYGDADPDAGVPMSPDMHQRVGSVTKTFTGTALMQLAEEGLLSLDDPISDYVDGVPNGDEITLRILADMTSGVASYTTDETFVDAYFAAPETVYAPEELVEIGLAASPIFDPGEQFNYSNTNTVLLGLVVEQVTGQDIGEVFEQRIFEPLGLEGTSWPGESPELPSPHPRGFTLQGVDTDPPEPVDATNWNPSWTFTAGGIISTVEDLLTYGRALVTGQGLLSPESQTERLESFPAPAGYGIALGCIGGWVGHTGELPGFNTSVFHDTTHDTTVIVAVNSDIASGDCEESPVLQGDPRALPCSNPATRVFVGVSEALGNPFHPQPAR
ncbi:serine hydrolase domain-containing protein [Rhabdothermincola salaria]|uniref:serine hydrolase domain-containing protein n=1 Tax=Rhabdothermincola salaria TaxID=2903142 RepID=UPI001E34EFA2|nr:serine hydrolase domain-containing protein [Rhabdothermincola salaria]MCD9625716.1 beta-lactamase family protein [Rhabdothermincola salaria]